MSERFLIIGAGGHGKVVADAIHAAGHTTSGFVDDGDGMVGQTVFGAQVQGEIQSWKEHSADFVVTAIGDNTARRQVVQSVEASHDSVPWGVVLHPAATISSSVQIGRGTVVMAGAVINADAVVGDHVIVNTGATIDHDCVIGDFAHIAPGVHLAGNVRVGEGALIGIGACAIPGIDIGSNAVVGAGAVVVRNVPTDATAIGVPARWKSDRL